MLGSRQFVKRQLNNATMSQGCCDTLKFETDILAIKRCQIVATIVACAQLFTCTHTHILYIFRESHKHVFAFFAANLRFDDVFNVVADVQLEQHAYASTLSTAAAAAAPVCRPPPFPSYFN